MKSFRKVVLESVEQRGLSHNRLAKESGLPQSVVSDYLTGRGEMRTDTMQSLCQALGLELRPMDSDN
jgi:ribosome-binding protein aMBF1 (putative translation factor)